MIMLHDKDKIAAFLQKNVHLHIYGLGDLDDFFWPYTTWYALKTKDEIQAIALLYTGIPLPTVLALTDDIEAMRALLNALLPLLPRRFYAHLTSGLESVLETEFTLEPYGAHLKMGLTNPKPLHSIDSTAAQRLSEDNLTDVQALYEKAYPGNWFAPRMLETGQYFGVWQEEQLVSIAGVHVYSPHYKVAALGNITTHPDYRGRGLAQTVMAGLCKSLMSTVSHIGLNVKADNLTALSLYQKLGFEVTHPYGEYMITLKR